MENVLNTSCRENENTRFMFNNFFPQNCTGYEIIPKNMVETERPHMTSQYGAYAFHAGLPRLLALIRMHTHTHTDQ